MEKKSQIIVVVYCYIHHFYLGGTSLLSGHGCELIMKRLISLVLIVAFLTVAHSMLMAQQPLHRPPVLHLSPWFVYENWCTQKSQGDGDYYLGMHLTSNNKANNVVTYVVARLHMKKTGDATSFTGEAFQYFSDRLWAFPVPDGMLLIPQYPFDPNRVEKFSVRIDVGTNQVTLGSTVFIAKWEQGILYGFSPNTMYTITFSKGFIPVIK